MIRLILVAALASAMGVGAASHELAAGSDTPRSPSPEADTMRTAECRQARHQLEVALSAALASGPGKAEGLERVRQQAALACLGAARDAPPATRARQPGLVVPSAVTPTAPAAVITAPPPATAPPPVTVPRPSVVTSCDSGGCWDSDGVRLHRTGPDLMGPRGLCTLQGVFLNCP